MRVRRRQPLLLLAASTLLGLVACEQETPETIELEVFPIEVRVEAPEGVDVGGIAIKFNRQDQRRTKADGTLRVGYQGSQGTKLHIAVVLPEDLWSEEPTEQEFVLVHGADDMPQPLRFLVKAQRKETNATAYVVVVDTECGTQQVALDGKPMGETNSDGYLSRRIRREPGGTLRVVVEKMGDCPQIACTFALPENGAILNVEPGCDDAGPTEKPDPAPEPDPEPEPIARAEPPPPRRTNPKPDRVRPPPRRRERTQPVRRFERTPEPEPEPEPEFEPEPEPEPERFEPPPPPPPPPPTASRIVAPPPRSEPVGRIVDPDPDPVPIVEDPDPVVVDPPVIEPPPPTVSEPVRPAGAREVAVSCRPAGLDLYVDGKLALRGCTKSSKAWMAPGVRKLSVEGTAEGRFCPRSKTQFAEIAAKGTIQPIVVKTDCQLACTDFIRDKLQQGQKPTDGEIRCLDELSQRKDEFLEGKLLLAHVYQSRGNLAAAEKVLSDTTATRKGRSDPEVRARLAEIMGRRKKLIAASEEAEKAWRYRMKFRGSRDKRERWILTVLKLRAGFFEQLFYDKKDRTYFDRAIKTYEDLERSARKANSSKMASYASAAKARLSSQEKQLLGD